MEILVRVDGRKCMANQMCQRMAPGFFELGPGGASRPTREEWAREDIPQLQEAEANCPTGAISVEWDEEAEDERERAAPLPVTPKQMPQSKESAC
jgi:ferredoxin